MYCFYWQNRPDCQCDFAKHTILGGRAGRGVRNGVSLRVLLHIYRPKSLETGRAARMSTASNKAAGYIHRALGIRYWVIAAQV